MGPTLWWYIIIGFRRAGGWVGFKVRVWVRVRVMFSVCGLGRESGWK